MLCDETATSEAFPPCQESNYMRALNAWNVLAWKQLHLHTINTIKLHIKSLVFCYALERKKAICARECSHSDTELKLNKYFIYCTYTKLPIDIFMYTVRTLFFSHVKSLFLLFTITNFALLRLYRLQTAASDTFAKVNTINITAGSWNCETDTLIYISDGLENIILLESTGCCRMQAGMLV